MYIFYPNDFAKEKFNLAAEQYKGEGITPLLEDTLGKENFNKYIPPQTLIPQGETSGSVFAFPTVNKDSDIDTILPPSSFSSKFSRISKRITRTVLPRKFQIKPNPSKDNVLIGYIQKLTN